MEMKDMSELLRAAYLLTLFFQPVHCNGVSLTSDKDREGKFMCTNEIQMKYTVTSVYIRGVAMTYGH